MTIFMTITAIVHIVMAGATAAALTAFENESKSGIKKPVWIIILVSQFWLILVGYILIRCALKGTSWLTANQD